MNENGTNSSGPAERVGPAARRRAVRRRAADPDRGLRAAAPERRRTARPAPGPALFRSVGTACRSFEGDAAPAVAAAAARRSPAHRRLAARRPSLEHPRTSTATSRLRVRVPKIE